MPFARFSERSKKMENKRKTKKTQGKSWFLIETTFANGRVAQSSAPTYHLAVSVAKEEKRSALYSGIARRVAISHYCGLECVKTYPEVTF